jgi:hypothetical protein
MDFTLDQLLTIVGRLDDSPGFDSSRERFRRFLNERITGLESARAVVQECREQSGEQSHRALQDAVVLCGRFLGFETAFGRYHHDPGVMPAHGVWHARRRLHVTLILCTDQSADISLDTVSHGITEGEGGYPRIGLLVVTPLYAGKERLENALATGKHPNVRLISLSGLLRFCGMVVDGRLTHEDVLQVLNPGITLDARLDFLEHLTSGIRQDSTSESLAVATRIEQTPHEPRFWVSVMQSDPHTPTEPFVSSLIATRQILGINPAPGLADRVRQGDSICVFVGGWGIVAHAGIAGFLTDGSKVIRDSKRFTHVLRLTDVTVYEAPVIPDPELALKLDLVLTENTADVTVPISRREFESMTVHAFSQTG